METMVRWILHIKKGIAEDDALMDAWKTGCQDNLANDGVTGMASPKSNVGDCSAIPDGTYDRIQLWVCDEIRDCVRVY